MSSQFVTGTDRENMKERKHTLMMDIKALCKGNVLLANSFPVFVGFWLALHFSEADFKAHVDTFFFTMIGSLLVMAGALVMNNWYDTDIDTIMKRTQHRPTVTGNISLPVVLTIGMMLSALGIVFLLFTTWETVLFAIVGWFTYVVLYTMWSKRRYTLNTVIGSISGAVSPLIGWSAVESSMQTVPLILALIIFIWQMPHSLAIAIRKHDDYQQAGVAMLPVVHGMAITKRQMVVYTACLFPLPLYLIDLGLAFVVVACLLSLGYLVIAIYGFFAKDDIQWARIMFLVSVNYLMFIFVMAAIFTFI
ncbi:protoheme IX farnesyltransferase [Salirhabdus euzebyi]|uniref:Protoheme IX farnesyltransferase n=1 Tax=Salirhabdus euzebyi TaxID=394506 RepID=A0A841PUT4_9BACI|nr:heme o synthase [Salirhabdus euzebyi]MBB6452629.1 protoheme IX farnesyltransferase [Salirhabdus euzebyi]